MGGNAGWSPAPKVGNEGVAVAVWGTATMDAYVGDWTVGDRGAGFPAVGEDVDVAVCWFACVESFIGLRISLLGCGGGACCSIVEQPRGANARNSKQA